jgi:predicted MFS family arabinose efflux permease
MAIAIGVGRFAYTPLLVVMHADAGLSLPMAGILASANLAGYLLGALAGMRAPRGTDRRREIAAASGCIVLLTACMALPEWAWLPARFLTGLCSGIAFVAVVSLMFDYAGVSGRRAGVGLFFSGVGVGIAAVGLLTPVFAAAGGSRGAWLAFAVGSFIVLLVAMRGIPSGTATHAVAGETGKRAGRAALVVLTLVYAVEGAVYIIPATFIAAMVSENAALAPYASLTWVVVGLVAAPSAIFWTWFEHRTGRVTALIAALVAQGIALLAPLLVPAPADAIVVALGLGSTFIGITLLATALGRTYDPQRGVQIVAMLTVWYGVGQIAGPLIATRILVLTGSYRQSLVLAAALLAATAAFAVQRRASRG